MTRRLNNLMALTMGITMALGLAARAGLAHPVHEDAEAAGPVTCEIAVTPQDELVALEALVIADHPTEGSYRFSVSKDGAGTAQIDQSGDFFAEADAPHSVSTVTLGASGGLYTARLEIVIDGETIACAERVGGEL